MNLIIIFLFVSFSHLSLIISVFLPTSIKELFLNKTFFKVQEEMISGSMVNLLFYQNGYLNYSEFENILTIIRREYSDILEVEEIGKSFQQKTIFAVKVGLSLNNSGILFTGSSSFN